MKIKHALLEVVDRNDRTNHSHPAVHLKAGRRGSIDFYTTQRDGLVTADIRRYVTDPERAEDLGYESGDSEVLVDWFTILDARLTFYGGRLTVNGYMEGVEGTRRDGKHPVTGRTNAAPYDDIGRPIVRVRWSLW